MAIPSLEAVEENNVVSIVDGSAVTMGSLTAGAGTTILVGNETSSGSLTVGKLTLGGGVLTCDPDFSSGGRAQLRLRRGRHPQRRPEQYRGTRKRQSRGRAERPR